jgi:hypothetical protein
MEPSTLDIASASTDAAQQPTPSTTEINGILYKLDDLVTAYQNQLDKLTENTQQMVTTAIYGQMDMSHVGRILATQIMNEIGRAQFAEAVVANALVADELVRRISTELMEKTAALVQSYLDDAEARLACSIRAQVKEAVTEEFNAYVNADELIATSIKTSLSAHMSGRLRQIVSSELAQSKDELDRSYQEALATHTSALSRHVAESVAKHPEHVSFGPGTLPPQAPPSFG